MEIIVLECLSAVLVILVLGLSYYDVSLLRFTPIVILCLFLIGIYHHEEYSINMKNEACIQETMAAFAGYHDVEVTDRYAIRALYMVEEHEDYKTCWIRTKDNRILKFNLFPDYSYQDVEVEK